MSSNAVSGGGINIGIYFGGSSLVLAYYRGGGNVEVIVNEAGDRTTPAYVAISNKHRQPPEPRILG